MADANAEGAFARDVPGRAKALKCGVGDGRENDNAPSVTVSRVLVQCGALRWGVGVGQFKVRFSTARLC